MPKISIHLLTWNGAKYIPALFESLRNQTFKDWEFLVIDNNSTDGTAEAIKNELNNFSVQSRFIQNNENVGFARGQNQACQETKSEYFLLLNQDIILEDDCLEQLYAFILQNQKTAVVAPRLMKMNDRQVVDSVGFVVLKNRRVLEIAFDEKWSNQNEVKEVFGVSGAVALFRRSAIEHVSFLGCNPFDESYHSYKEDVDLAYRLRSAGFSAYVVTGAVAYHDRTALGPKEKNDVVAAFNKTKQSEFVRFYSYKNHLATIYKNEYWQNLALDFPWVLWYETKKLIYFLLFDRQVLAGLKQLWQERSELKIKRLKIKELRKVNWKEMRKWYV